MLGNLILQLHLFPTLNAVNVRPIAERVGLVVGANPESKVAIYSNRRLNYFNYYSKIRRFELARGGSETARFFNAEKPQFLLLKNKHAEAISQKTKLPLEVILESSIGPDRWVLLSGCKIGCDPVAIPAVLGSGNVAPLRPTSGAPQEDHSAARGR